MKTGELYIDGKDAYSWGVYIAEGGYNELIAMPPLKAPPTNDWHEEDGIEVDLENPVLDSREVNIKFVIAGLFNRFEDFMALLADRAYHIFNLVAIDRTYKLRLVSTPRQGDVREVGLITLRFADDFPMLGYQYEAPTTILPLQNEYYMDDVDISRYGIRILKGTRKEMQRAPAVKTNLIKRSKFTAGCRYDDKGPVRFKSKDAKMNCLIRAGKLPDLWRNYDAFLHDMTLPGERRLYIRELEHTFLFFYKNCKVQLFSEEEKWLQFTITITISGNIRPQDTGIILSTEQGDIVITEDEINMIDLQPQPKNKEANEKNKDI